MRTRRPEAAGSRPSSKEWDGRMERNQERMGAKVESRAATHSPTTRVKFKVKVKFRVKFKVIANIKKRNLDACHVWHNGSPCLFHKNILLLKQENCKEKLAT